MWDGQPARTLPFSPFSLAEGSHSRSPALMGGGGGGGAGRVLWLQPLLSLEQFLSQPLPLEGVQAKRSSEPWLPLWDTFGLLPSGAKGPWRLELTPGAPSPGCWPLSQRRRPTVGTAEGTELA